MNGKTSDLAGVQSIPDQRSQYIIKSKLQYGLILESVLATFILVNTIVVCGYFLLEKTADMQAFREFLGFSIAFIEILGFMIIVYFHRRSTHRIAGPIFTLENTLQELTKGKLGTHMVLRHTDHFQEVCDQVNDMTTTIGRPIARSQALARELQLATMKGEVPNQDTVDELVNELSFFTTVKRESR